MNYMENTPTPSEEPVSQPRRGHTRRPPLAEIDTWELWQAWRRGERKAVWPWVGLLAAFCMVLAAMYSFFFFSSQAGSDSALLAIMTVMFIAFFAVLWRRISPRRGFALAVVALLVAVSGAAFLLWLALY